MKKIGIAIASVLSLAIAAYGARGYFESDYQAILPAMTEPPPGPKAPDNHLLGVAVGHSRFEDIVAYMKGRNPSCRDTSARALMKKMRAQKAAELEARIQAGEPVDAVSAASAQKRSPMERNPQIRYACEKTEAVTLDGRSPSVTGRALFVFDSEAYPLRHASFRRLHPHASDGIAEARHTLQVFTRRFGAAHDISRELPTDAALVESWKPYEYVWRWSDLEAKVTVIDYGKRGFSVFEVMQVPLPIRPDAPMR